MDNGIKKKNGDKFELTVRSYLTTNGITSEDQPSDAPKNISYSITPDFYIPQSNTWVFAQQALHGGGLQNDRCEHVFQMVKNKVWNKGEVFYVVLDDSIPSKSTRKKNYEKRTAYRYLQRYGFLGAKEKLLEVINGTLS